MGPVQRRVSFVLAKHHRRTPGTQTKAGGPHFRVCTLLRPVDRRFDAAVVVLVKVGPGVAWVVVAAAVVVDAHQCNRLCAPARQEPTPR